MRHYNFAEDEPKDEKADESGDENEDVSFFLLDDADNSGEKSGDAANSCNKHRDSERQIAEKCFAAPLAGSDKK